MTKQYAVQILRKGRSHWWRVRRCGNHQIVLTSETYSSAWKARDAAHAFALCVGLPVEERKEHRGR